MCHLNFFATQNPVQCEKFSSENFRMKDRCIENKELYDNQHFVVVNEPIKFEIEKLFR